MPVPVGGGGGCSGVPSGVAGGALAGIYPDPKLAIVKTPLIGAQGPTSQTSSAPQLGTKWKWLDAEHPSAPSSITIRFKMIVAAGPPTMTVLLYDYTAAAAVAGSTTTSTSTAGEFKTTSALTLVDTHEYGLQWYTSDNTKVVVLESAEMIEAA